jgi:hypothetical protein
MLSMKCLLRQTLYEAFTKTDARIKKHTQIVATVTEICASYIYIYMYIYIYSHTLIHIHIPHKHLDIFTQIHASNKRMIL